MKISNESRAFLTRVGGFFGVVLCAILLSKRFYPGFEAIASLTVCFFGIIFAVLEHIRKRRKRAPDAKRRRGFRQLKK